MRLTVQIVVFSLMIEAVGFLFLTMVFVPDYGFKEGSFISIFTSISAFNNAGFGLFSDNLMSYSNDLIVNILVPALIILGGIGFIVNADIWKVRRFKKLRLHTKIVFVSTLFLIVFGFLSFWLLEADNVLQGLPIHEHIFNAFFQSVTTRTAGFNTVDIGQINVSTLILFIVLMFIGAAPMSTAGGIKVTTFSLILIHLYSGMRGTAHPHIFKKSVDYTQINKAVSVFLLAFFAIFSASFIIVLCHPDIDFIKILFEVVSAFGTVGLSTGITEDLNNLSKIVIIIVMILGKIGLFILLTIFQTPSSESYYYAKEKIEM